MGWSVTNRQVGVYCADSLAGTGLYWHGGALGYCAIAILFSHSGKICSSGSNRCLKTPEDHVVKGCIVFRNALAALCHNPQPGLPHPVLKLDVSPQYRNYCLRVGKCDAQGHFKARNEAELMATAASYQRWTAKACTWVVGKRGEKLHLLMSAPTEGEVIAASCLCGKSLLDPSMQGVGLTLAKQVRRRVSPTCFSRAPEPWQEVVAKEAPELLPREE